MSLTPSSGRRRVAACRWLLALAVSSAMVRPLLAAQPKALCQYAIFYNGLLEFSTSPPLTINAPVHANGSIYTGSSSTLTFNATVTCSGIIASPAWNGGGPGWANTGIFNGVPPSLTNTAQLVPPTLPSPAHALLDLPAAGENPLAYPGQDRLYNQASTLLLVSNLSVAMKLQVGNNGQLAGADPAPIWLVCTNTPSALATNFPFLSTTNLFTDQRELRTVLTTQIDVGRYGQWLRTNAAVQAKLPAGSGLYPTILYVADLRTTNASQMTGVRLTSGIAPPVNGGLGWSLATPNPLYVWGHFNCTNPAYLGTTNTSSTLPCALMSDALTILSPAWKDSLSSAPYTARAATDTTLNAALLTGSVPSTGPGSSQFSGGVANLPRLLENWTWSPGTLTLNTAFLRLFDSALATHQFINPGTYYEPPIRRFSYDLGFQNLAHQPPGIPWLALPGAPTITHQPQGLNIPAGSNATLTLSADGYNLRFRWWFNGTNSLAVTDSPAFTLTNAQPTNAGNYSVWVDNPNGPGLYGVTTSTVASVTVGWPPSTPPLPGTNVLWGRSASLAVAPSGTGPLHYQWYKDGQVIPAATNSTLDFAAIQLDDGGLYSVVVSNAYGSLTDAVPLAVTAADVSLGLYSGVHAGLAIEGTPGYTYDIQFATNLADAAPWTSLTNLTLSQAQQLWLDTNTDTTATPQGFYRVVPAQ